MPCWFSSWRRLLASRKARRDSADRELPALDPARGESPSSRFRTSASTSRSPRSSFLNIRCRRPSFRSIDFHGHPPQLTSAEALTAVVKAMDDLNVRRMVVNNPQLRGDDLKQWMPSPIARHTRIDSSTSRASGSVASSTRASDERQRSSSKPTSRPARKGSRRSARAVGLSVRKADGSRLAIDDPELDPLWEAAARLNIPVFIHTADPQKFWDPIDYSNERWLELALFRDRRYQDPGFPRFETLIAERDHLFRKHPEDDVRHGPSRLARQRSRPSRPPVR